jgi:hypothetical protein
LRQDLDRVVFENLIPKRNERGRPIVHNERGVFCEQALHQVVKAPLGNTAISQQLQAADPKSLVLK